jgi:diguanylate cyclase (GGDEF)-like protein
MLDCDWSSDVCSSDLRSLLRRVGLAQAQLAEAEKQQAEQRDQSRQLSSELAEWQLRANTDAMTGLLNRRAFLNLAEQQVAYARRYGGGLAAVVADIDHFKAVNDTHGHAVGDIAIREVAQRLKQAARDSDLVARFGGEEFVVLLMASDLESARVYAERVRAAIAATPIDLPDGGALGLTVSLGCTALAATDKDIQDAIDRADRALYEAKNGGRNCVRLANAQPLMAPAMQAQGNVAD